MVLVKHTSISGVLEIVSTPFLDDRGSFLNVFRSQDSVFNDIWPYPISQVNISTTVSVGTIRGLHIQRYPHSEAKLVRCIRGCVWDVVVDLRPSSATYGKWCALYLSPSSFNAILVPSGCAHGFQALQPASELLYFHSGHWFPDSESGIRYDDSMLAINWPLPPQCVSDRDLDLPSFHSF